MYGRDVSCYWLSSFAVEHRYEEPDQHDRQQLPLAALPMGAAGPALCGGPGGPLGGLPRPAVIARARPGEVVGGCLMDGRDIRRTASPSQAVRVWPTCCSGRRLLNRRPFASAWPGAVPAA